MPSLKYRSAPGEPLAPLGFGSHKLDDVRRIMYEFSNQVKVPHNVTPIDLLAQSAALCCPNATYLHDLYIHPSNLMQIIILWRVAVEFVQTGTVGRICKSAPTVYVNFMDEWIACADATRYGRACGAVEKVIFPSTGGELNLAAIY